MNTDTHAPQSPESYSTFWEPIATTPVAVSAGNPSGNPPTEAKDAYLEFTEITEGIPAKHGEHS
jgi:hypothetical protein